MRLETSSGKSFEIRAISEDIRRKDRVLIELIDTRPIPEIAQDFDGLAYMKNYKSEGSSVYEMYEGFTKLSGVNENEAAGTIRLTLRRSENA